MAQGAAARPRHLCASICAAEELRLPQVRVHYRVHELERALVAVKAALYVADEARAALAARAEELRGRPPRKLDREVREGLRDQVRADAMARAAVGAADVGAAVRRRQDRGRYGGAKVGVPLAEVAGDAPFGEE